MRFDVHRREQVGLVDDKHDLLAPAKLVRDHVLDRRQATPKRVAGVGAALAAVSGIEHGVGVEHRSIHADALHGGTGGRLDADGAAGATADGAGHEFFE